MDDFYTEKERKPLSRFFLIALAVCVVAVAGIAVALLADTPKTETPPVDLSPSSTSTTAGTSTTRTTVTTAPTTKPTDVPANTEPKMLTVLPLSNTVAKGFSGDTLVFSDTMKDWRTHNGTDFSGKLGQTVKAAADATVKTIEADPLWGGVLTLSCGEDTTIRYCGVTVKKELKAGDTVKVGDTVGTLSEIPAEQADTPHLHLEVQTAAGYTDPVKWIGRETKTE